MNGRAMRMCASCATKAVEQAYEDGYNVRAKLPDGSWMMGDHEQ